MHIPRMTRTVRRLAIIMHRPIQHAKLPDRQPGKQENQQNRIRSSPTSAEELEALLIDGIEQIISNITGASLGQDSNWCQRIWQSLQDTRVEFTSDCATKLSSVSCR